jgi:septal ring factor EnvC (AmiA/AmiB activator)
VSGERPALVSRFSILYSLFLVCALQAQIPSLPLGPPETALPTESLPVDVQQLDREIQDNQLNLEQTKQRLTELNGKLVDLAAKEQAGLARIASLEEQMNLTRKYIRQLQDQTAARTREIAQVAQQIQKTTTEVKTRRQDLGRRLTSIYKYGRLNPLEALLSTRSMPEIYRKMLYLRWIARADQRLAAELSQLNLQLALQRTRLVAAHTELERLQRERLAQQATLSSAMAAESALLKKVRGEKETSEGLQQQLAESAGRLRQLLAGLQRRKEQARLGGPSDFETGKGKLPWPLRGKIIAGFGSQVHPRYKTRTSNLGIDIKAEPAAPVQSVAPGRVAYADQFMGYGNLVIIDHGAGFYTLYANLDELAAKVGTEMAAGTRVGSAGDYLHFEIRKDGKPINPVDWLEP